MKIMKYTCHILVGSRVSVLQDGRLLGFTGFACARSRVPGFAGVGCEGVQGLGVSRLRV